MKDVRQIFWLQNFPPLLVYRVKQSQVQLVSCLFGETPVYPIKGTIDWGHFRYDILDYRHVAVQLSDLAG